VPDIVPLGQLAVVGEPRRVTVTVSGSRIVARKVVLLTVVADAGHSALEPGVRTALVAAVERFRRKG